MNKLTEKVKNTDDYIKLPTKDKQEFINKLGKLEDLLQSYNIKDLEELDKLLEMATTYEELSKQIDCPLEKFLTTNEIYSDLEDGTIKKYKIIGINFCEKKIYFWMSFVPMNVDFTDYKKYYWLREDKNE